ncbi:MAG: hypothetical protein WKF51_00450 [Geodermatophilaceae bacterium]
MSGSSENVSEAGLGSGDSATTPETPSSRGLADILAEAGISPTGAGGRRRRRDSEDTPEAGPPVSGHHAADRDRHQTIETGKYNFDTRDSPQSRAEAARPTHAGPGDPPGQGSAADSAGETSLFSDNGPGRYPAARTPSSDEGLGDNGPLVVARPAADRGQTIEVSEDLAEQLAPPRTDTGPVFGRSWVNRDKATSVDSFEASAAQGLPMASHTHRSPSPVAVRPPLDPDEEAAAPLAGGMVSWVILVVELLAALGLGVGAWYAFSALWELLPFVAAFAGPLVVTGLVAVAGALRARTGRNPLGLPTLCVLVFAGMVLVVLPAATAFVP